MSILDQFKLDGQTALVTGCKRGIGKAMAIALAEAGADILIPHMGLTTKGMIGATTALTDLTPWGFWIGFDVMGGVALAAGDFDGDGMTDQAAVHTLSDALQWRVLLSSDEVEQRTRFGSPGDTPIVGDFDGDGNLDFVIARDGPGMAVGEGLEFFLGDGAGGFAGRRLLPLAVALVMLPHLRHLPAWVIVLLRRFGKPPRRQT